MDQFVSEKSEDGACGLSLKEEKKSENSVCDDESSHKHETVVEEPAPIANPEISMVEAEPSASPSMKEEVDDQLEITKAQMGEVREENQRLKKSLNKIMNEYRTLEMQFQDIVKQDQTKTNIVDDDNHQEIMEESDLVSLSLGRVPSNPRNNVKTPKVSKPMLEDEEFNEDLTLGLETSKSGSTTEAALPNPSPVNSCEVPKEEEAGETSPPTTTTKAPLKTMRDIIEDEVAAQQTPAKKARVCVRARCDTPTMNDGCQWRKYGQKISKGNPCPRAYYRCTVAPSCPVRKQVQRCAEDMSILITTYEGAHNHNLPQSATAMASTTSAAASMLLSGSSTSHSGSNNLHGLNFYLSSDGSKSKQLHHLSNPAFSSSSHHDHPTITLDLTSNPNSSSSLSSPFVRFNSNQLRYPSSTSLSFNSSESNAMSWTNNGFLNYATPPYNHNRNNNNNNSILSSVNFGRQTAENIYQSYMQKTNNNSIPPQPETVSAATKAITAHPNFQSALAAALTSFIGSSNIQGNQGNLGQKKMTWAELFPAASSSTTLPSTSIANIGSAASSLFNKTPSLSLPFSTSKSASTSPGDSNGDAE